MRVVKFSEQKFRLFFFFLFFQHASYYKYERFTFLFMMFFFKDDHSVASALGEGLPQNLLSGKRVQDREQSAWKSFGREWSSAGASWQRTSGILFLWKGKKLIINKRWAIRFFSNKTKRVQAVFSHKILLFRFSSRKMYFKIQ